MISEMVAITLNLLLVGKEVTQWIYSWTQRLMEILLNLVPHSKNVLLKNHSNVLILKNVLPLLMTVIYQNTKYLVMDISVKLIINVSKTQHNAHVLKTTKIVQVVFVFPQQILFTSAQQNSLEKEH